jgi:AsmA family protein
MRPVLPPDARRFFVRDGRPTPAAIAIGAALLVVLLPYLAILWIESESGQRWLERRAASATGREVSIGGIDVKPGWRPGFRVSEIRVGNPEWAKTSHLIDAGLVDARLRLLPLLFGRAVFEDLTLVQARLGLEREEGRATWQLRERRTDEDFEMPFVVRRINIDRGHIAYRDTLIDTDLAIDVEGDVGADGGLRAVAQGVFRGEKAQGVARAPNLMPSPDTPVEISAAATIGRITAAAAGIIRDADVDGIDLDLDVAGENLADLSIVLPLTLPKTAPYRLRGRFRNPSEGYIFDPFWGRVGDSDLGGGLTYRPAAANGGRGLLTGELRSHAVDLDDLGPLVGAPPKTGPGQTAAPEQKAEAARLRQEGRVLPQQRFAIEDWPKMDADIRYRIGRVTEAAHVPIHDVNVHWLLKNGVLRLDPLRFRIAQGDVVATVQLDGNQRPAAGRLNGSVRGLELQQLFPPTEKVKQPLGRLSGRIDLNGRGSSVADLFGTGTGRVALAVDGGYVSHLLVELLGLDVSQVLNLLATRDARVRLRCAVADLQMKNGIATPEIFVIDTTDTLIQLKGTINFKDESLDLVSHAEPKDISLFALRSPIMLQGTLRNPQVRPQAGPIAARGAAALLLGMVNPLLAGAAFLDFGKGYDADCGALVSQARKVKK